MGRDKATGKVSKENSNKDFKVFLEKTETGPPRVTESPGSRRRSQSARPFSEAAAQPSLGLARERAVREACGERRSARRVEGVSAATAKAGSAAESAAAKNSKLWLSRGHGRKTLVVGKGQ